MTANGKYLLHLRSAKDLETTYQETRAGFIAQALERTRRATPFVEEGRALKAAASVATSPGQLLAISSIQSSLLTAAGVSDKARGYMEDTDKIEAVQGLIDTYLEPAGADFVDELVFRFLLTRGDTLGGSMRNIEGAMAQQKVSRALIAALSVSGQAFTWMSRADGWIQGSADDPDIEYSLRGLSWSHGVAHRTFVYNRKVAFIGNNVDFCLLDCPPNELKGNHEEPKRYIGLGELKGGIDPAGADEHWKTATRAFSRIREAFARHRLSPCLFFVGAAIESKMATEIWAELEQGRLSNAANLTDPSQIASLCNWLAAL